MWRLVPLRGNVPTRVARVNADLDAIVLARAGLVRLELDAAITEIFTSDRMLPAPAQGAMAIQCRAADRDLILRLWRAESRADAARRSMPNAPCSTRLAAAARCRSARWRASTDGDIHLTGGAFSLASHPPVRATLVGTDPSELGKRAADALMAAGAGAILAEFRGPGIISVSAESLHAKESSDVAGLSIRSRIAEIRALLRRETLMSRTTLK